MTDRVAMVADRAVQRAAQQQAAMVRNNGRVGLALAVLVAGMIGLSFAAVPLYDLFCRVTGWGGTTQTAATLPGVEEVVDREVRVRFRGETGGDLAWRFRPAIADARLRIGEGGYMVYTATNPTDAPLAGTAVYNVSPDGVGQYFMKVQCFCFDLQTIGPGETVEFPVQFFVDPALADDPEMDDVYDITLSYTFYPADSDALAAAQDAYYAAQEVEQGGLSGANAGG